MEDSQEFVDVIQETPADNVFIPPSVDPNNIQAGASYSHFSAIPKLLLNAPDDEVVLGVDEAGRGPVLGPMVYAVYYLPKSLHQSLLCDTHHFDDSKVLTPSVRSRLMETLCTSVTDLFESCGWATRVMSARDISAAQLKPVGVYNLNAQAMDATIDLIQSVFNMGVNVKEIYVDTIGQPAPYQARLEKIFPTAKITVAKKADSLYPCVSAASVCAKVTRDAALEVCYDLYIKGENLVESGITPEDGWGSGYPSDARCSNWLKRNKDPLFGWGTECRFSWSTAKELLDAADGIKIRWPAVDDGDDMKMTDFAIYGATSVTRKENRLTDWFGSKVSQTTF